MARRAAAERSAENYSVNRDARAPSCLPYTIDPDFSSPRLWKTYPDIISLAETRGKDLERPYRGELTPREFHAILNLATNASIVDVRTKAECDWVGRVPNAIEIEWNQYPGALQPKFYCSIKRASEPRQHRDVPLPQRRCARLVPPVRRPKRAIPPCFNILEGFEGDKDAHSHRSTCGGWRFAGLPWLPG